ncbi:class I SAM-dependent methyltransferase [Xanthobacter agilis]|uniref:SAM-dependent methyltransferase n=1 Tax=Xanthobacter agilis TaxID=47492 RepID=A0ABU0LFL6_XANAG|nr:class I SAM-dependent methyltransferase [Xanthobacter agilis]MDQ0505926.1 SAM-dependent methyltransferase [Xanthobacter agilis]
MRLDAMFRTVLGRRRPEGADAPAPKDSTPNHGRKRAFRAALASLELVEIARREAHAAPRLLDIGGAHGIHARFFRKSIPGLEVDIIDARATGTPLVFTGFYENYQPATPYDFIWASHVLEHVQNPGVFLAKLRRDLKPGGWVGLTVPPLKHEMTFAHVTLWNAGLLLINLIRSGFDCSDAHVATDGYNVSVLVQNTGKRVRSHFDALPQGVTRTGNYFEGRIDRLNWTVNSLDPFAPRAVVPAATDPAEIIRRHPDVSFVRTSARREHPGFLYLDHEMGEVHPVH